MGIYDGTSQPEHGQGWDRSSGRSGRRPARAELPPASLPRHIAVSLLLKGVSLDSVSKLLGHSSIKITERHYAPGEGVQDQLESEGVASGSDAHRVVLSSAQGIASPFDQSE
ncbi:MAG: hypothetical protein R2712_03115 [Vicinamibacterales bacterium]